MEKVTIYQTLTLLDIDNCKIKKLIAKPGENPSYQYHHKLAEDWIVI
jgi:hypothetical protein